MLYRILPVSMRRFIDGFRKPVIGRNSKASSVSSFRDVVRPQETLSMKVIRRAS